MPATSNALFTNDGQLSDGAVNWIQTQNVLTEDNASASSVVTPTTSPSHTLTVDGPLSGPEVPGGEEVKKIIIQVRVWTTTDYVTEMQVYMEGHQAEITAQTIPDVGYTVLTFERTPAEWGMSAQDVADFIAGTKWLGCIAAYVSGAGPDQGSAITWIKCQFEYGSDLVSAPVMF
jgi:hypothetical protein